MHADGQSGRGTDVSFCHPQRLKGDWADVKNESLGVVVCWGSAPFFRGGLGARAATFLREAADEKSTPDFPASAGAAGGQIF